MPPRANTHLQSQFSLDQSLSNEVICPLHNQDGSMCRKKCIGEKRYRSMQEHIRRAHPEYYIPKLPATKESFDIMITSPPHERPAQDPNHANHNRGQHSQDYSQQHSDPSGLSPAFHFGSGLNSSYEGYNAFGQHDGGYYSTADTDAQGIYNGIQTQAGRASDEYRRGSLIPAASAAAALAQLHYHRANSDWDGDHLEQNYYGGGNNDDLKGNFHVDPALEDTNFGLHDQAYPVTLGQEQSGLLPSSLARSPPDRSATLPPLQDGLSRSNSLLNRPRKSSLTQPARISKHERKKSNDFKRRSGERKVVSEGSAMAAIYGKRWEDLIDAAKSATEEEGSRDLTPIPGSPYQSPQVNARTSLPPPFALGAQFQSFQASPLNRALTPPTADDGPLGLQTFPSVDSSLSSNLSHQHHNSAGSGSQFHIMNPASMDSTSSPMFTPAAGSNGSGAITIYCSGCRRQCDLKDCFACTGCICGLCGPCTDAIISEQSRGRMSGCPRCHAMDSSFKPFALDFR